MKIAIIGGGNMGGAIARGLAQSKKTDNLHIMVSNPSAGKLQQLKEDCPNLDTTHINAEAAQDAQIVILAVKPWLIQSVLSSIHLQPSQIVVSLAAGICFNNLLDFCNNPSQTLFRVIPNTAIAKGESMTILASCNADKQQDELIEQLFSTLGATLFLPEEKMGAATALASCGIAYVLKYVQAAMQAGTEMGIPPKDAMKLVSQSLVGAASLLQKGDTHPALEIDKVTTPGGITIKGINELEHAGFSSAIIRAMNVSNPK